MNWISILNFAVPILGLIWGILPLTKEIKGYSISRKTIYWFLAASVLITTVIKIKLDDKKEDDYSSIVSSLQEQVRKSNHQLNLIQDTLRNNHTYYNKRVDSLMFSLNKVGLNVQKIGSGYNVINKYYNNSTTTFNAPILQVSGPNAHVSGNTFIGLD